MNRLRSLLVSRWKRASSSVVVVLTGGFGLLLLAWLFIAVSGTISDGDHRQAEERWMLTLRDPANLSLPAGPWWLTEIARDLSALGGATVVVLLSLLSAGYLLLRGRWRRVVLLVLTIVGGYALSTALKSTFARERPSVVPHLTQVTSASFPSGHSLSSSVVYLTIGALLAQAALRRREKLFFVAAAFLLTFLIGASRVFLGVHYPSDVLAGWIAGTAWALVCWLIAWRLRARHSRSSEKRDSSYRAPLRPRQRTSTTAKSAGPHSGGEKVTGHSDEA
jgi:undecaprenyl-diphosphatase